MVRSKKQVKNKNNKFEIEKIYGTSTNFFKWPYYGNELIFFIIIKYWIITIFAILSNLNIVSYLKNSFRIEIKTSIKNWKLISSSFSVTRDSFFLSRISEAFRRADCFFVNLFRQFFFFFFFARKCQDEKQQMCQQRFRARDKKYLKNIQKLLINQLIFL